MKISYNWLKQFLQIDWDAQKTGELLTDLGLEVEGISQFESVKGGLKGIVVGHVLTCEKHPNADKLKLTTVDVGQEAPLQIVCGAPNVAAGQKVPVATVGTTLYTKEGEAWVIKKGKIRGEVSQGMICAEDEIGVGESHDGIMVLNEELVPGTPCSKVFEVENDEVFEIGLTPNRADAMSHFGVARDLKAGLEQKEIQKELVTPSVSNFSIDNRSLKVDVEVMESDLAPRYCGVTISNLVVQDSPDWLKNRLKAIGLTPINNIVDVTNYVLHELGQPLHAFDASKIKGSKVEVKTLPAGTKFTTLDEVERELHEDDLIICDANSPMCIAGVFGGLHSGVTEHTTSIFLESAYFDPVSIRKTAKRHGLNTDASFRFERGIDINMTKYALKRAALLIREIAGGYITSEIADLFPKKPQERQVFLTFSKINSLIGQEIPQDTIKSILSSLEIRINNVTESGLGLTIPTYRVDVTREVDVIEEILRVFGYNNIDFKEKLNASIAKTSRFENYRIQDVVGSMLASKGFYEIMTNSLVSSDITSDDDGTVQMLNPLSSDLSVLRTSMLHSGLQTVSYNHNRQKTDLKLFEFGKTYHKMAGQHQEKQHLAIFISGDREQNSWAVASKKSEFFYLKGIVDNVFERLGLRDIDTKPLSDSDYAEGVSYVKNNKVLVSLGLVGKAALKRFDIKQEVFHADLDWDAILESVSTQNVAFKEIPKFPEVTRDFALLLDDSISFQKVYDIAWSTEKKLLKKVNLFDVYTGKNLPDGKKSYAVSFTLMDEKKTLTDKQIDKIMGKLLTQYQKELGAELR
ncbi:phenylalanine--tRNA ligase subunit beta [Muricauda sp. 334s03]|uniref:Phenylalanine--tRNA ligase beta subunit n=1 Tax=Flagellimonas yonaguniensis TaxID=3031325 RepID=A0ABT5XZA7_9FLAO|nr:phenylalanine--tRNA ligase subunit beta [[Muricauda] yonaguniensis]MDF0716142.1 phenylalanine--tRNA ligase subunit beta [[Muricauda] yonaguniensis]